MKVLITGSSGFLGNYLSSYLASQGYIVVGLDIKSYLIEEDNYIFEECDITDFTKLLYIFNKYKPTHIIHLAYLMDPLHNSDIENKIDVEGSKNILKACNQLPCVKQLIFFSSARVYGAHSDNKLWIGEDTLQRPTDRPYGTNKVIVEKYFQDNKRESLKVICLRMCTACGPSYNRRGGLIRLIKHSPALPLVNGTDMDIQLIHEDDVKALITLILNDREIEGDFNFAPDSYSCLKELAPRPKLFFKISEKSFTRIFTVLWKLHLGGIEPSAVSLSTYGIVISPKKIMDRYNYKFKYSTKEAFHNSL